MVAPALTKLSQDLDMHSDIEVQMTLSIFVLAYAIGPIFLGPMSEIFGRVRLLQLSNLFYFVWNLECGFAQNKTEMFVFRFLSGIAGSAPLAIGGGVLSDCWHPEQRGKVVGIYSLAPLLGPVVGPIAGGFIAEKATWRWVFWSTSIVAVIIQIVGLFFLRETYAPILLKRKAAKLGVPFKSADSDKTICSVLRTALVRPFRLLTTQPIVQVIALYMAYLFGLFYLILSTSPQVWGTIYHENIGIGGLNYISLGVGYLFGAQVSARLSDSHLPPSQTGEQRDRANPNSASRSCSSCSVLIPIGLFWYGWSIQAQIHWIMPNVGMAIFCTGAIICLQMHADVRHRLLRQLCGPAGLAAAVVSRSLAGFGFPLFAPYLYHRLDYGWGNSVLGFVSVAIGLPAPVVFWIYGKRLRGSSRYAAAG